MSFLNSRTRAAREGIGTPVRRKEDARLVTGSGCFSDDFSRPGQAYACMVRSPHAHARLRGIDSAGVMKMPGVIAVLTGEDAAADRLRPIPHRPVPTNPHEVPLKSRDSSEFFIAPHAPLPTDRARFVGEAVAMVIAETPAAAKEGAERVIVDYEPLPGVTATADAVAAGAGRNRPRLIRLGQEREGQADTGGGAPSAPSGASNPASDGAISADEPRTEGMGSDPFASPRKSASDQAADDADATDARMLPFSVAPSHSEGCDCSVCIPPAEGLV